MRASFTIAGSILLLLAGPAAAQPELQQDPDAVLAKLSDELLHARFSRVLPMVRAVLEREDLTARQRNEALEVLAVSQVALGDPGAEPTLEALYRRDPGHRLTHVDLGPSVQAAFARARERAGERAPVTLGEATLEAGADGGSPFVAVAIAGEADAVSEVVLSYRDQEAGFTRVGMVRGTGRVARARLPVVGGGDLSYFVEARAPSGATLATLGSPSAPLRARMPAPARGGGDLLAAGGAPLAGPPGEDGGGGLLSRWWFWSAVALVVGGAVGAWFLVGPPSQGPEAGSLGQGALE